MRKILKLSEEELISLIKKKIDESKYSSVANTLRGNIRKSIKTIAILTAENPHAKESSSKYNKMANEKLEDVLVTNRFGFRKVKGSYGNLENSYIINNISLDSAIALGKRFEQESIVYGEVVGGTEDEIHMNFKMFGTLPENYREELGSSDVFINRDSGEDMYTEVGGRRFAIPFYNVIDNMVGPDGKVYKVERDYSKSKWKGGETKPSDINISLEDRLNDLQEQALNTFGSTSYYYRCRIDKLIKESENS